MNLSGQCIAVTAGEPLELVEMPVTAEIHGVRLVGRADRIHLEGRRGRLVLEFKFSGRRELFPSHVVQVEAYGRMLEAMGFQTDRLLYGVAVLPRGRRVSDALARKIAESAFEVARAGLSATDARPPSGIPDPLSGLTVRRVDDEAFGLWVFRHSRQRVERDLHWATSYWTARSPAANVARAPSTPPNSAACPRRRRTGATRCAARWGASA